MKLSTISELFDSQISLRRAKPVRDVWKTHFDVGGREYAFTAKRTLDKWQAAFHVKKGTRNTYKQQNLGDQRATLEVFSAVMKALMEFISEINPPAFWFTSDTSEESRVRLYDRLAGSITKRTGYRFSSGGIHNGQKFYQFTSPTADERTHFRLASA